MIGKSLPKFPAKVRVWLDGKEVLNGRRDAQKFGHLTNTCPDFQNAAVQIRCKCTGDDVPVIVCRAQGFELKIFRLRVFVGLFVHRQSREKLYLMWGAPLGFIALIPI